MARGGSRTEWQRPGQMAFRRLRARNLTGPFLVNGPRIECQWRTFNFARAYSKMRGRTPAKAVEAIRVDGARRRPEEQLTAAGAAASRSQSVTLNPGAPSQPCLTTRCKFQRRSRAMALRSACALGVLTLTAGDIR